MSNQAYNLPLLRKYAGETFDSAAIIDQILDGLGSSITISSVSGTATVRDTDGTAVTSGGPTVSSITKNSSTYTRPTDGATYAANKVITYTIAGGTKGTTYWVDFEVTPSTGSGPIVVRQPVAVD